MKFFLIIIIFIFNLNNVFAKDLNFYIKSSLKNNSKLNAERENLKAIKQNINISRSEFLPSISLSGEVNSSQTTKRKNQAGVSLPDANNDIETKTFSVDQKLFQGFQGYNSLKKSELEVSQANFQYILTEQEIILSTVSTYLNLIYKTKNKNFNISNVNLFERQVESDSARLQKGEITLTDLAQSESSLAGANAKLIAAETELVTAKTNFEKITGVIVSGTDDFNEDIKAKLPMNLKEALEISKLNNPRLKIAELDYEIAKKEVNIEKANLAPSASLNYSKSKNNDFSATIDENEKESVKATVKWPIITGGKNYSSIKKSKFKRTQSNLLLENTINEVKSEVTNAWALYQSAESVMIATMAQLKAAEIANEGISLEYDSGNTRTTLELIQSRSLLLDARIANAKARRDFVVSKFELLSQLGTLKPF